MLCLFDQLNGESYYIFFVLGLVILFNNKAFDPYLLYLFIQLNSERPIYNLSGLCLVIQFDVEGPDINLSDKN